MNREGLDSSDTENLNEVIQGIEVKDEEELADNDNNDGDQTNDKNNRNRNNNKNNDNDINDGDGSSVENSRDSRSETKESLYSDEEYTDDGDGSDYTEAETTEAPSSKRRIIFVVLVIVALIGAAVGITLARRGDEEDDDNDVNSVVGTPNVPTIPTSPSTPSPPSPPSPSLFVTLSPTEAPDTASSATLPPSTDSPVDNDNTPSSPSDNSNNPGPTPIEIPPNFPSPDDDGYSSIDPSKDPYVYMKFECRIDMTIFVDIDSSSVGAMSTVIEDSVRQEIGNEAKCQVTNIGGVANTRLRRSLLLSPKKRVPGRTLSITAVRFNIYHKLPCVGNGTCKREERDAETLFRDLQGSIDSSISQNYLESTIRSTASSYGLTNALTDTVIDGHDCDDDVNIEVFNQKEKQEDDDCCCSNDNKRSNNDVRRYAVVRGMDKMALKKVIVNALLHE